MSGTKHSSPHTQPHSARCEATPDLLVTAPWPRPRVWLWTEGGEGEGATWPWTSTSQDTSTSTGVITFTSVLLSV